MLARSRKILDEKEGIGKIGLFVKTSVIDAYRLDLVWFGVLYLVNLEIGLITSPMGVNLYFVPNTFNIKTTDLLKGAMPFPITLIIFLVVVLFIPQSSLWLPNRMTK